MVMKALSGKGIGGIGGDIEVGVEKKVGTFTINGTTYDRYVKVVNFGTLPNNTSSSPVSTGITGAVGILGLTGITTNTAGAIAPIPYLNAAKTNVIAIYMDNSFRIVISTTFDASTYTKTFVAIEYYR